MSRTNPPRTASGPAAWLNRVLASIGAALALVVSFFLGALVFLTALGLLLLLAVGVAVRIWWLRRQFRRHYGDDDDDRGDGGAIEGEYVVVERRRQRKERPRQEE